MTKKIIIDTDPGVDDAMAILFALACPEFDLIGLTTIFGNVTTRLATENALRLVEFAGRADIPVAHGADAPLAIDLEGIASYVHGNDGLGNTNQPPPVGKASDASAAHFIVEQVMANPGEISLLPIGPLTNIALALAIEPRIAEHVDQVVIMGGAVWVNGNATPAAEANVWHDPHAADKVLTAGWPVTLVGLDVTSKVVMEDAYFARLRETGLQWCAYVDNVSRFYRDFYRATVGVDGCYTHDPSVIAYLLDPSLFTVESGPVRVLTEGIGFGKTMMDRNHKADHLTAWSHKPYVNVCLDVDDQGVLDLYFERMTRTPQ